MYVKVTVMKLIASDISTTNSFSLRYACDKLGLCVYDALFVRLQALNTLPGFKIKFGSQASLILRISSSSPAGVNSSI